MRTRVQQLRWWVFYTLSTKRIIRGIEVLSDVHAPEVQAEELFERLDSALALVEEYQPWRFVHLQRYLGLIIIRRRASNRAALINATTAELDWTFVLKYTPAEIAASVIHESVHARLIQCLGRGDEWRRVRDERLCRRAEVSFAGAIPDGGAVHRRAAAAIAAGGEDLAPTIDWVESEKLNRQAYWDELGLPKWLGRLVRRRGRGGNSV